MSKAIRKRTNQNRVVVKDELFTKLKFKAIENKVPMSEIVEAALEKYFAPSA